MTAEEYTEEAVEKWSAYINSGGSIAEHKAAIAAMFREYGEGVAVRQRAECAFQAGSALLMSDMHASVRKRMETAPLVDMP